jgi:hypothetical protein
MAKFSFQKGKMARVRLRLARNDKAKDGHKEKRPHEADVSGEIFSLLSG